jgi:uncharacterized membrane protein
MINPHSTELARVLSTSVAPVFLITGIAAVLSIMSLRYGRVIDRIRTLLRDGPKLYQKDVGAEHLSRELRSLYKRARLLRLTIIFEIIAIFFVALTIFAVFFSLTFEVQLVYPSLAMFIASFVFLLIGLALFISDFAISLSSIKHDMNTRAAESIETPLQ